MTDQVDGGAHDAQAMLDAGAPADQVQRWAAQERQKMLEAGAPVKDVDTYWGAGEPDTGDLANHVGANLDKAKLKEPRVAEDFEGVVAAGLNLSVTGLALRQAGFAGRPYVLAPDASLGTKILAGGAQLFGDAPAVAGGYFAAAGAGVTAAVTASAALPETLRQTMMRMQQSAPVNGMDVAESAGKVIEAGATAAIGGAVGGKIGAAVTGRTGSATAGAIASAVGFSATATTAAAIIEQKAPSTDDFVVATVMGLGLHVAGEMVGATQRFQPSAAGRQVMQNLRDIYVRTGIPPREAVQQAAGDEALKSEIFGPTRADGETVTPGHDEIKPPEMEPYHQDKPEVNAETEAKGTPVASVKPLHEDQGTEHKLNIEEVPPKPAVETPAVQLNASGQVPDDTVNLIWKLENSGDSAVSPAGAIGRGQIMPGTARDYGFNPAQLFDPAYNEHVTRTILADLSKQFDGNLTDMLVAYNAGPGAARTWIRGGRQFDRLPLETQHYIQHAEALGHVGPSANEANTMATIHSQEGRVTYEPPASEDAAVSGTSSGSQVKPVSPIWTAFADKEDMAMRQLPDGSLTPAPEAIASYLKDFGDEAGFRFVVGPEATIRGEDNSPQFAQAVAKKEGEIISVGRHIYIPEGTEELSRRWYGLGKSEVMFHEVGHAIDGFLNGKNNPYTAKFKAGATTKFIPEGPLKNEIVAASKNFRPKLWSENPRYNSQPNELMADAIAVWLSDPTARAKMPEFSKLYGQRLQKFVDIAARALPRKVGNSWEPPPPQDTSVPARVPPAAGGGQPPREPPVSLPPDNVIPSGGRKGPRGVHGTAPDVELLRDEFRSMIAPETRQGVLPDWLRNTRLLLQNFEMALQPGDRLDRKLGVQPGQVGIADMFRMTFASVTTSDNFYMHGVVDAITRDRVSEASRQSALEAVKSDGGNTEDWTYYRIAKRTIEKGIQGIETGFDPAHAQQWIEAPGMQAKYERATRVLQEYKNNIVDYGRDSGLWNDAGAASMKALNQEHIVLRRQMDPDYNPPTPGRQFSVRQPVKRMEGSNKPWVDPWTSDLDNDTTIIAMADRNRALANVVAAVEQHNATFKPGEKGYIGFDRITARPEAKVLHGDLLDEDGNVLMKAGEPGNGSPFKDAMAPFLAERRFDGHLGPDDFVFYRNGEPEVWRARDPDLAKLLRQSSLGKEDPVPALLRTMASIERSGVTGAFSFGFRSVMHGQLTSPMAEGGQRVPFHDVYRGIMAGLTKDGPLGDMWDAYDRFGGAGAAMAELGTRYVDTRAAAVFEETGTAMAVWNTVRHPIEAMRLLSHLADKTARVGFFDRNVRKGVDPFKAAMLSRKAYLDHAEQAASSFVNAWARTVPFMNTALKDIEQVTNAIRDRPVSTLATGAMVLTLPTLINYGLNMLSDQGLPDDQKYGNLPQWERDMYWSLPPIFGVRLKIMRPYDFGFMFATMPEHFMDWARGQNRNELSRALSAFSSSVLPPTMPTLVKPIIEQLTGFNLDLARPLVPASVASRSPQMRYTPDTSEMAKALSNVLGPSAVGALGFNPVVIQNYASRWLGTLPMQALRVLEQTWKVPTKPSELADNPFVGSFFVRNPGGGQALEDFFNSVHEVEEAHADLKAAIESGDPSFIQTESTNQAAFTGTYNWVKSVHAQMATINAINASKTLTDAEKRSRTDSLTSALVQVSKAAVQAMDALK